jgi:class 3 adenylate cyclase
MKTLPTARHLPADEKIRIGQVSSTEAAAYGTRGLSPGVGLLACGQYCSREAPTVAYKSDSEVSETTIFESGRFPFVRSALRSKRVSECLNQSLAFDGMAIGVYGSRLLREHLLQSAALRTPQTDDFIGVVLLVDIADSTAMADRFAGQGPDGAERLGGILNRYFGDVFSIVDAHGGDTIRIEGDAVLAVWREEPGQSSAVLGCARAAIELREAFINWRPELAVQLRHRLALGGGRLRATSFRNESDRSFFVVTGEPIQALADAIHGSAPNEIVVTAPLVAPLQDLANLEARANGHWQLVALRRGLADSTSRHKRSATRFAADSQLREFLPRIVLDRADSGHSTWLAEFRTISMVFVNLCGLDHTVSDATERIHAAVGVVHDAIRPLRLVMFDLAVGDKGAIVVIACGVPPFAQENNAVRALEASRRICESLGRIGIESAIGVSTGRAFCGDVGNESRREYLINGPVMNYGARLMQATDAGIICDDATARAAAGYFRLCAQGTIAIKGRADPLAVHRVDASERAALRTLRLEGALYGRDHEAGQLVRRLGSPKQDRGGVIAIEAEPGAGKSRLLAHVGFAAQARGCKVIATATSPIETMTAYYALRPVVRQLLLLPTDPLVAEVDLLRHRLGDVLRGDPLEAKAALIDDILPLGILDKRLTNDITGPARLVGLEDILVRLINREATDRSLVVLVDDLHWLDDPSARLLLGIAKRVPRLLIATATRPLDAVAGPHVRQVLVAASPRLQLQRLGPDSITRIVCETLGVRSIPARLGDFIHARSEGLPFHAEQLALSLRDQNVLEVSDGRCRFLMSDLSSSAVGDSLRDVIVSRIDTLDSTHQLAVRVASAIGRTFEVNMLGSIYPFRSDVPRLGSILEHLVGVGILEPALGPEGTAYAFRHILIQEVIYELLTFEKRAPLHRSIAHFIEDRHRADIEPYLAELASHWERADELEKAIAYRERAAMAAIGRYANHDALLHVEKIEQLATCIRKVLPREQQARLALIRGDAWHELSRFGEAHSELMQCAVLSGIFTPSTRAGLVKSLAIELSTQVLHRLGLVRRPADAESSNRGRLAAHIFTRFAEHAYFKGDALELVHATLSSLNHAERVSSVREIVEGFGGLAIGLGTAGLHSLADYYRSRSVTRAEADGGLHDQGFAHLLAAVYCFSAGKWKTGMDHCRRGAEICLRIGDRFRYQSCRVIHAYSDLMLGNYASAEEVLRSFGEDVENVENGPVRAWILVGRAILDMIHGREPALALSRISAARDDSLHSAERLLCDGLEGAAWLQAGNAEQAMRAATAALDNMLETAPTMGIALLSVSAATAVHLVIAETSAGSHSTPCELVDHARAACKATRLYALKTRIFRPRALLLSGRLAMLLHQPRLARRHWRRALNLANQLEMPLEQALCHLSLAACPGAPLTAASHRQLGFELLQRLGARPWVCDRAPVRHADAPIDIESMHVG